MPLIFIHGVNVRNTDDYYKDVAVRDELLRRLVINPLSKTKPAIRNIAIENPYWGNHGVSFGWNQASLPNVSVLESLGGEVPATQSDIDITTTIRDLSRAKASALESLGTSDHPFKSAALKDPVRVTEAILSPVILSETPLAPIGCSYQQAALYETLLMLAARDASHDPEIRRAIRGAPSDQVVLDILKNATQVNFERLLDQNGPLPKAGHRGDLLEPQGGMTGLYEQMKDKVGEIFDRAIEAPARAGTVAVLAAARATAHKNASRFFGDVFIYLKERDSNTAAGQERGPIVSTVLDAINSAQSHNPGEPLIVITHSMGGNILYDILTHYQPETTVSAWVSVASQVAQFEEMKLFKNSDKSLRAPRKIQGLRGRIGYWLNVYDPADVFAFLASPVFQDVNEDLEYHTGESAFKAHGTYFKRPSFYDAIRERFETAIP